MSDRRKPHQGRDLSGHYRVRQTDVDDLLEDPEGTDLLRDDVRLGGAVADTGIDAAKPALEIEDEIEQNREDVARVTRRGTGRRRRRVR